MNCCSFFLVIFVLFGVLQHPAQELIFIFRGNFRTFWCSEPSGPRIDVLCRGGDAHIEWSHIEWSHIECSHRVVIHRVLT